MSDLTKNPSHKVAVENESNDRSTFKSSHRSVSSEKLAEKVDSWRKAIAKKTVRLPQINKTIENTRGMNDNIHTEKKQKKGKLDKKKSSSKRKGRSRMTKEDEKRINAIKQGKELDNLFADVDSNWKFNPASLADLRRQLATLHTAADFTLTKQNTPLNSYINYATSRGKRKVQGSLHRKLPEKPPGFQTGRFRNCSVVGSSGILTGSGCGNQIDSAEFVIRFNLPPLKKEYVSDVGRTVDLVTCNRYRLKTQFGYAVTEANKKKFVDFLNNNYPELSYIWLFPFSFAGSTVDNVTHVADVLREHNSSVQAVFSNPRHMFDSKVFWAQRGVNGSTLTSGMNLITLALDVCEELYVYGFWPWLVDRRGQEVNYHYENGGKSVAGLRQANHNMPEEFSKLLQLYKHGVLRLVTTTC
ncbi:ST8SIA1 [Branchiostoma lanceolatum]|nr:ST8SIA1 [Branchiostoma lanceolatum]